MQHLLLAMNAHINVDLAAAAAETGLPWPDYSRVDAIFVAGIAKIQSRLNAPRSCCAPWDWFAGDFDEMLTVFSLLKRA